jgi:hypothetical protein
VRQHAYQKSTPLPCNSQSFPKYVIPSLTKPTFFKVVSCPPGSPGSWRQHAHFRNVYTSHAKGMFSRALSLPLTQNQHLSEWCPAHPAHRAHPVCSAYRAPWDTKSLGFVYTELIFPTQTSKKHSKINIFERPVLYSNCHTRTKVLLVQTRRLFF